MSLKSFIVFIMLAISFPVSSQENCTVPLPPVLTLVSVQPQTGNVDIYWNASPSDNIAAYIIYLYSVENDGWISVDTVRNASARSYTYVTNATRYMSVRFVVAAYRRPLVPGRDGCPSELSNSLSTIFCSTDIDTCNAKINLKWNKYQDSPKKVTRYKILVSENDAPFIERYDTSNAADSYTIKTFSTDTKYCYVVRANLEDGSTSESYKNCILTSMQRPPAWINNDYVRVNSNDDIELSFSVDPASGIKKYVLERAGTTFQTVATLFATIGHVSYTDRDADPGKVNNYRLKAVNSCDKTSMTSGTVSNIVPVLRENDNELLVDWNPVIPGKNSHNYSLFVNTGQGYSLLANTDTVTRYLTRLEDVVYKMTAGDLCFRVNATEINNPHGNQGESISSQACLSPEETITVPNIFTPNGDLLNDLFKPVLSFTPPEYHLLISDRNGKVLFETVEPWESWNGSDATQGVYLWFLKLTTPSGRNISRTGTVTVKK